VDWKQRGRWLRIDGVRVLQQPGLELREIVEFEQRLVGGAAGRYTDRTGTVGEYSNHQIGVQFPVGLRQ